MSRRDPLDLVLVSGALTSVEREVPGFCASRGAKLDAERADE